jgi:hypothetical protein
MCFNYSRKRPIASLAPKRAANEQQRTSRAAPAAINYPYIFGILQQKIIPTRKHRRTIKQHRIPTKLLLRWQFNPPPPTTLPYKATLPRTEVPY